MPQLRETEIQGFKKWLQQNGAEILPVTNPYELIRWKGNQVGIMYSSGKFSSINAENAFRSYCANKPWTDRPKKVKRTNAWKNRNALLERDGKNCFYCGKQLGDDITIEHLISVTAGGSNNLSNLVLAHSRCNNEVNHLPLVEKVKIAIQRRNE